MLDKKLEESRAIIERHLEDLRLLQIDLYRQSLQARNTEEKLLLERSAVLMIHSAVTIRGFLRGLEREIACQ